MALGYQGLILLDNKQYLVTDGNLDHSRPEIASEGTYSPSLIGEATNKVHVFDLDLATGGFNFDTNIELLDDLFNASTGWIPQRDKSRSLLWYSNQENDFEFGDAYWSRISLSAGPGNMLTTSMDVSLIPSADPSYTNRFPLPTRHLQVGDNYIDQTFGFIANGSQTQPISFSAPLRKMPIPYWQTKFNLQDEYGSPLPDGVYITNWSLEITNNVSRRTTCAAVSGTSDHPGPTIVQIGLASVTLNATFVTVVTPINGLSRNYSIPERFSNATISIGTPSLSRTLSLGRLNGSIDGNDESTALQESSDATNITGVGSLTEYTYIAQGYFTLPHLI